MIARRKVLPALKHTALTLLALIVCLAAVVPIQQRIFRWRAERLLADMQSIELHKTTWDQAQVLMHRWGKWGHYDGTCTAENCKYTITLWDSITDIASQTKWNIFQFEPLWTLCNRLGWRSASFRAELLVQNGTIRRTLLEPHVDVPKYASPDNYDGYLLIASVQSASSLNSTDRTLRRILGAEDQLVEHPYYKAGRPTGCTNCMAAEVTYALDTPPDEIRRLTSFDLSCLTRLHPCTFVEDILPAAKPWHLYGQRDPATQQPPESCKIPLWALGRDAASVAVVDALSVQTKINRDEYVEPFEYEMAQARFEETLKGKFPWQQGTILTLHPDRGSFLEEAPHLLKPTVAGKRYLVLIQYPFWNNGDGKPLGLIDGQPGINLALCGIVEDTPQNRQELQRGFAANDPLQIDDF